MCLVVDEGLRQHRSQSVLLCLIRQPAGEIPPTAGSQEEVRGPTTAPLFSVSIAAPEWLLGDQSTLAIGIQTPDRNRRDQLKDSQRSQSRARTRGSGDPRGLERYIPGSRVTGSLRFRSGCSPARVYCVKPLRGLPEPAAGAGSSVPPIRRVHHRLRDGSPAARSSGISSLFPDRKRFSSRGYSGFHRSAH
ncbi:hypothetical protein DNTS_029370 [Danionella cerebrum]|uniref:Uncharacterized protein n=1 Tax=Danionella cerebrum TaxID=2873325 RepID=A0A553Q7Y2_9TELE|nr:hypothetical protein DNTS_029370 [Danionella translucida]